MLEMTSPDTDKLILSIQRKELEQIANALRVLEVFYENPEQVGQFSEVEVGEMLDTLFSFKEICTKILDG